MLTTDLKKAKTANIVVRVLEEDKDYFKEWVEINTDMKMSEFIRQAMEEKISRTEVLNRRIRRASKGKTNSEIRG